MNTVHVHDKSCLAGAIWTKQRYALAFVDTEVYTVERLSAIGVCECKFFN
jgi:hypothetical protein